MNIRRLLSLVAVVACFAFPALASAQGRPYGRAPQARSVYAPMQADPRGAGRRAEAPRWAETRRVEEMRRAEGTRGREVERMGPARGAEMPRRADRGFDGRRGYDPGGFAGGRRDDRRNFGRR